MAYVYVHYQIDKNLDRKIPFYVGMSKGEVIKEKPYKGKDPHQAIKHFIKQPYNRMLDFGPESEHGFKAKLSFDSAGEKSKEYIEFLKDKTYGVDYTAEVIHETDDVEIIYFIEFLLVKKYGFRHDKGLLFNKIDGGCINSNGNLQYQFSFDFLLGNLKDSSLTWNPNFFFTSKKHNSKCLGDLIADDNVCSISDYLDLKRELRQLKENVVLPN
jgi:hypothetical protein